MTLKDRKKLTNREQEVYDLVLKGLAYIDIARRLVIEEGNYRFFLAKQYYFYTQNIRPNRVG